MWTNPESDGSTSAARFHRSGTSPGEPAVETPCGHAFMIFPSSLIASPPRRAHGRADRRRMLVGQVVGMSPAAVRSAGTATKSSPRSAGAPSTPTTAARLLKPWSPSAMTLLLWGAFATCSAQAHDLDGTRLVTRSCAPAGGTPPVQADGRDPAWRLRPAAAGGTSRRRRATRLASRRCAGATGRTGVVGGVDRCVHVVLRLLEGDVLLTPPARMRLCRWRVHA